ncbi:MAG: hypothetical protein ACRDOY_04360 [Nocardioidaceae bacterium]
MFLDDVERCLLVMRGDGPAQTHGGHEPSLDELLRGLTDPKAWVRVEVSYQDGQIVVVTDPLMVGRWDVTRFELRSSGGALIVDRDHGRGYLEVQSLRVAMDVLRTLERRRQRRFPLAWRPYELDFVPMTRADHRQSIRHRSMVALGFVAALAALAALVPIVVNWLG